MSESDDLRAFIRDLMARFDRGMDRQAKESRRYFETIRAHQEADRERLDDILAENRVQRQALLNILDEMRGGNGGTAPAG
ncbi:MAG: hypothetical protein QOI98_3658 [Solirubrobacteraceae bacterium]|jgi:hypothetical protein|nr:hypothetical protein [Solirubrobacteraceae bacterium]